MKNYFNISNYDYDYLSIQVFVELKRRCKNVEITILPKNKKYILFYFKNILAFDHL